MPYDWLSLNRLGNTGSRGGSKNNLRGIMIGPSGGLPLLPLGPLLLAANIKTPQQYSPEQPMQLTHFSFVSKT